jgi:hypothetical protein
MWINPETFSFMVIIHAPTYLLLMYTQVDGK